MPLRRFSGKGNHLIRDFGKTGGTYDQDQRGKNQEAAAALFMTAEKWMKAHGMEDPELIRKRKFMIKKDGGNAVFFARF